jgi:mitochondrial fission protein ELM1
MSVNSDATLLLLNDGRPGHWRQVRALAHYLSADSRAVKCNIRQPWRMAAPRKFPFGLAAHSDLRGALAFPAPRAIVSCGRVSALAARWLQGYWERPVKTVQILDCGLNPESFTWVIAPRHDRLRGDNVLQTTGSLNRVDDEWLASAAGRFPAAARLPEPRIGLLLGGPSRHFPFNQGWLEERLATLAGIVRKHGGSLITVVTARTPPWVEGVISELCAGISAYRVAWPAEEAEYAAALAHSTQLVVTADSVNLASEACATGKPVFLIGENQVQGRIRVFCDHLLRESFLLPLESLEPAIIGMRTGRCLREAKTVAGKLLDSGLLK